MGILDKGAEIAGARGWPASPTMRLPRLPRVPPAPRARATAITAALVAVSVTASVTMLGACTVTPWHSSASVGADAAVAASEAVTPSSTASAAPIETQAPAVVAEVPPSGAAAGFYRVKAGDTLSRIAAAHQQRAADIAVWNKLHASGMVKAGQLLRVAPPAKASATASEVESSAAPGKGLTSSSAPVAPAAPSAPPPAASTSSHAASSAPAPAASNAPAQPAGARANARLAWPVSGSVVTPFAPGKSRSIVIACAPGAPVKAAAAGRVVYAGSGMKGYGKLVIVKHDTHLITAYGRNGRLLVKQGDTVKLGQQIATSGADAAGVGALLFEVRENGRPVDPVAQLPRKQL